jgi:phosphosulfolactate synthase (CoM biosynthesis protein A)
VFSTERRDESDLKQRICKRALWTGDGCPEGLADEYSEAARDDIVQELGITENVGTWRTDVAARIIQDVGLDAAMFEAADPDVFEWYIKNYGPRVNLFVDHTQTAQLACLRAGLWGTKSSWGRIATYQP